MNLHLIFYSWFQNMKQYHPLVSQTYIYYLNHFSYYTVYGAEKKMNKKMLITFAIVQLFLIGSLLAIASSDNESITTDEEINDTCTGNCDNCDRQCDGIGDCKSQGNSNCDWTENCIQKMETKNNCESECESSKTCPKNTQQSRNCRSGSICPGSCNN